MSLNQNNGLLYLPIIISVLIAGQTFASVYPQDFNYSKHIGSLLDAGFLWHQNSLFHPLNCAMTDSADHNSESLGAFEWLNDYLDEFSRRTTNMLDHDTGGLHIAGITGTGFSQQFGPARTFRNFAFQPFAWCQFRYHSNWYVRAYLRATNEAESLPHYTGTYEGVERFWLKTAEMDQGVIGFKNEWVNIEYGRTREIWGPMTENNLILSGQSPSYDRFMMQVSRKRLAYRYFFAFLEAYPAEPNILRYAVGRCFEYTNYKNLILGVSETTIFAGPNRPLDMAYLNPIGFGLEIDLDDRSNVSINYDNAVWGIYLDWLARSNLRISASFAVDEYQLDEKDREAGAADGLGYFGRISWTPYYTPLGLTLFIQGVRLDTHFGQHSYGFANLVSRGVFLGHPIGNDTDEVSLGVRCISPFKTITELEFGRSRRGENSILQNPYDPYSEFTKISFPSGQISENSFLKFRVETQLLDNLIVHISGHVDLHNSSGNGIAERYSINLIYLFPFLYEY